MNSISLSLARLRVSFSVMRSNKSLIFYTLVSLLLTFIILGLGIAGIIAFFSANPSPTVGKVGLLLIAVAIFLTINLVGIFAAATIFTAASGALEGEKTSFRTAISKAWKNRKHLAEWWLFSSGVFFLIFLIQLGLEKLLAVFGKGANSFIASLTGNILGTGWSLATYFAIPVIMTHPDTPLNTLKRSASLFKRSWGENVTASGAWLVIGVLALMASGLVVTAINYLIFRIDPTVPGVVFGIVFGAISGSVLAALILLGSATQAIFNASLYRYAETGDYVGPYPPDMIKRAFQKK